jgi:hypothetical protein
MRAVDVLKMGPQFRRKNGKRKNFNAFAPFDIAFSLRYKSEEWAAGGERMRKIFYNPKYNQRIDELRALLETASFNQIEQAREELVEDVQRGEIHVLDYSTLFSYMIEPVLYHNGENSDLKDYKNTLGKQGIRLSRADIQYRNTLLRFLGAPNLLAGLHKYFEKGDTTPEPLTLDIDFIKLHLPEGETYFTPQGHLLNLKQRVSAGSQNYNAHLELVAGINLPNDRLLSEISLNGKLTSPSLSFSLGGLYRDGPEHGHWIEGELEIKPFLIANEFGSDLPRILEKIEAGIRVHHGNGITSERYNKGHDIIEDKETRVGVFIGINTRF